MFNFYIDNSTFPNGLMMADINPIQDGGGGKKSPPRPTSFSPVTSTNVGIGP